MRFVGRVGFVRVLRLQGAIGVPGSVGAVLVERPANIEEGFSQSSPIVYHYGHKTPGTNTVLYNQLVSRLADVVRERMAAVRKAEVGHLTPDS